MADSGEQSFDDMFELLYEIVPEGFKGEIVGGAIFMTPQRSTHWEIIADVLLQMKMRFGRSSKIMSDVRLDLPGSDNAFAPDLFKLSDDAERDEKNRWRHQDVEFVLEVISRGTIDNDYGKKKTAYAVGEIPVYLIANPYTGRCHLHTLPKDGEYWGNLTVEFGQPIDLTDTALDMTLETDRFPQG
ncbi:Uma2 family endonuclease [Streptomyces sp. NRRL B-1677]|uniref:Uma2 family endonuclease n=2 Tax=Streptomyces TaxID=1883 RepID=A0A3B0BXZ3_9ACTN|nr:Uma2 family endonuclease [Streptomyces sp. NRRL B-1677]RKN76687.1 Uma2 family endonuclease [Streptomyces klenkii]